MWSNGVAYEYVHIVMLKPIWSYYGNKRLDAYLRFTDLNSDCDSPSDIQV